MAAKNGIKNDIANRRRYQAYVDGNTARELEGAELPEKKRPERVRHAEPQTRPQVLNFPFVVFLVAVAAVAVYFCVMYLGLQADISQTRSNINSLKSEIDTLTVQNDSIDYEINAYMDIDYIIRMATEELGMVLADEDQVSVYDQTEKEYMKQYEDIE